jgi:divalent metal cation (Fe/Co/Zn/Cd) transporter
MSEAFTLERTGALRRGRRLQYFTIGWNFLEGLIAVVAGLFAGSISLVGFGIDSFVEMVSGAAVLWRIGVDSDVERRELNEKRALKVVGGCFLALSAYIAYESVVDLWSKTAPEHSVAGIILACTSLVVMPMLSRAKLKVGSVLRSAAMSADAKQTQFCTYLSGILLGGLLLNSLLGLWWADPLAALLMAPIIANEGIENLKGNHCGDCGALTGPK